VELLYADCVHFLIATFRWCFDFLFSPAMTQLDSILTKRSALVCAFYLAIGAFFPSTLFGAHLIGGDVSYTCQGNNDYEVTIRIYRDCAGGGAQFDPSAVLSIYDINNNLIQTVLVPKGPTIPISPNPTGDPCLVVPPNLCSEYADYVTTINLPPLMGGYVLSFQRCCRNSTITNVPNSGSWGNTWTTQIPSMDTTCNNSPSINAVAPTIICLGEDINLSLSASEPDGDSLFYELCEVFSGGGQGGGGNCNSVVPNPACPPPFTPVPYTAGFTAANPLPASPPLSIDPQTGLLTGVPNQIGQYLVGFCVSEYRNGQLLSTVRQDYQFNVSNCGRPASDILTPPEDPSILCDGLTVKFVSQSINGNDVLWDFGVVGINTDTSTKPTTQYTYPQAGIYTVSLIINPGDPCSDTATFDFDVKQYVDVDIQYTGVNCFEVQGFEFEAVGFWPTNATLSWLISPGANISTWSGPTTPPITWSQPGLQTVEFIVQWGPNCIDSLFEQINVTSLSLSVDAGPDQSADSGQTVQLFGSGGVNYFWYADKPAYFNNQFIATPLTLPLHDTTKYYMEVSDENGCRGIDSCMVYRNPKPSPPLRVMNVITPNGDGRNDVLNLTNLTGEDLYRFVVLDRWGKQVYDQDEYDHTWNGVSSGGQALPDGTYYFILQQGDAIAFKGPVTIIRLD
jgi:gliding motility-associated-like protein